MYRPMDRQISMDEAHFWMPGGHREKLERGWPHIFRTQVLKMIPESRFADLYHTTLGRPNTPVAILVSLSVLKEMFDQTDEALMGSFQFDLRFHYALGLTLEETGTTLRTLEGFRARVARSEAVGATFDEVTDQIIKALGLNTGQQRHDSTHFRSNMANLTRLGLFTRTIEHFLGGLAKGFPDRHAELPEEIRTRYGERNGRFADARSSEGRRRLEMAAADLWFLVGQFREDDAVARLPEFRLLERLLAEQCRTDGDDGAAVILKEGKEIPSDSLQSPFDPDASYDGHKGVGYQAQLSETCAEDNPIQVITRVEVEPAHLSDQHAIIPALDALEKREIAPEEMFADTAYNSGDNLIAAAERGVNLMAPTPGKDPDGIGLGHFDLDLGLLCVNACPEGAAPVRDHVSADGNAHNLLFDPAHCQACDLAFDCPAGKTQGRLRVTHADVATAYSRVREESDAFKKAYAIRAGIESTNAECKTAHGLGKVWTRGLFRVAFAVRMKALACNVKRFLRYSCAQMLKKAPKMVQNAV